MVGADLFKEAMDAIENDDQKAFQSLLDKAPDIVSATHEESQWTLLHYAAKFDRDQIAKLLIESGSSLDAYPENSYTPEHKGSGSGTWTPLSQALHYQSMKTAELLASNKVVPDNLWTAVGLGSLEKVKSFFDQDGQLKDNAGDPGKLQTEQDILNDCFCVACHMGNKEIMEFLLDRGAEINGKDHWGMTALHWLIQCHPQYAKYLIDKGADVRIRDAQHVATQLSWAFFHENKELAEYMIANCPIHIVDAINLERMDLLKKALSDDPGLLNGPLGKGEPLRMAAAKGCEDMVEFLLEKGASPKYYDVEKGMFDPQELKFTALQWAKEKGHDSIAKKLQEAGAEK